MLSLIWGRSAKEDDEFAVWHVNGVKQRMIGDLTAATSCAKEDSMRQEILKIFLLHPELTLLHMNKGGWKRKK